MAEQGTEKPENLDTPADEADDEQAIWNELDDAEGTASDAPPPEGRETGDETGSEAAMDADTGTKDAPSQEDGAAKAADKADIWASAPPELRAAYEESRKQAERLEHQTRSDRGRISALQRKLDEAAFKGRDTPADTAPAAGSLVESDEFKALSAEYPEVATPIAKALQSLESRVARYEKQLAAVGEDRLQQATNEQETLLAERLPDWKEVASTRNAAGQTIQEWVDTQPRHIREAALRNWESLVDAEEAADVIGRFKATLKASDGSGKQPPEQGRPNQLVEQRRRRLQSAVAPASRSPSAASGIPEDGDEEAIWKMMDAQEARQEKRSTR